MNPSKVSKLTRSNNPYATDEANWQCKVRQVEVAIESIRRCLITRQFCDKWGEFLVIGDMINEGRIANIRGQWAAMETGLLIHWSYLKKVKHDII